MSWGGGKLGGLDVTITVIQGRDLVAKDRSLISGRKTSSDPYIVVAFNRKVIGRTHTVARTLNPRWWHDDSESQGTATFSLRLGPEAAKRVARLRPTSPARQVEFRVTDEDKNSDDDPMGVVYVPLPVPPPVPPPVLYEKPKPPKTIRERRWYPVQTGEQGTNHYCKNPSGEIEVMLLVTAVAPAPKKQSRTQRSFSIFGQKRVDSSAATHPDATPNKREDSVFSRSIREEMNHSEEQDQNRNKNILKAACLLIVLLAALAGITVGVIAATKPSGGGGQSNGAAATSNDDFGGNAAGGFNLPQGVESVCAKDKIQENYNACDALCEMARCCFDPEWIDEWDGVSCSSDKQCEPFKRLCKYLVGVVSPQDEEDDSQQHREVAAEDSTGDEALHEY